MKNSKLIRLSLLKKCLSEGATPSTYKWLSITICVMIVSAASFAVAPIFLGRWIEAVRLDSDSIEFWQLFAAYLSFYAIGYFLRDAQWSTYARFEKEYFKELNRIVYLKNLASEVPKTETELSMGFQGVQGFLFSFLFLVVPYGLEAVAAVFSIVSAVSWLIGLLFVIFCVGYVLLLQWSTKRISAKNRSFVSSIQSSFNLLNHFIQRRKLINRSNAVAFTNNLVRDEVEMREHLRVSTADVRTRTSLVINLWILFSLALSLALGIWSYRHGKITFGSLVATESFFFQIMRRLEIWARGFRESSMYSDQVSPIFDPPVGKNSDLTCIDWKESLAHHKESGWIVIQGATGSGKSTLLQSWADEEGNEAAYVGQFPEILPISILDNLCMGKLISEERIDLVLKKLDLDSVLARLPNGIHTTLCAQGSPLSGGELQRLSLARAILLDRKVLFLDEPTSSQPEKNEPELLDALRSLTLDRRVIFVSHRNSISAYAKQTLRCQPFGKLHL